MVAKSKCIVAIVLTLAMILSSVVFSPITVLGMEAVNEYRAVRRLNLPSAQGVPLRSSQNQNSAILAHIPAEEIIFITAMNQNWARTSFGGRTGYVQRNYLSSVETFNSYRFMRRYHLPTSMGVPLRSSTTGGILTHIPAGERMFVRVATPNWARVNFNGQIGVVPRQYLAAYTLTLSPATVTINNNNLRQTITVGGTATGAVTVDRRTLPPEVQVNVSGNTITVTGQRGQSVLKGIQRIYVYRQGLRTALYIGLELTPVGGQEPQREPGGYMWATTRTWAYTYQNYMGPTNRYISQGERVYVDWIQGIWAWVPWNIERPHLLGGYVLVEWLATEPQRVPFNGDMWAVRRTGVHRYARHVNHVFERHLDPGERIYVSYIRDGWAWAPFRQDRPSELGGWVIVEHLTDTEPTHSNRIVEVARGELGNTQHRRYTEWWGSINGSFDYHWCGAFVAWVFNQAGAFQNIGGRSVRHASVAYTWDYLNSHGRAHALGSGYTPRPGDLVFFNWNTGGSGASRVVAGQNRQFNHISIIVEVTPTQIHSISGNSRSAVRPRTVARNSNQIIGFGQTQSVAVLHTLQMPSALFLDDELFQTTNYSHWTDCPYELAFLFDDNFNGNLYGLDEVIPLLGDVNGDGEITDADVSLIRMYLAGHLVNICLIAADVNGDGEVTDADVSLLRMYLAGHPVQFIRREPVAVLARGGGVDVGSISSLASVAGFIDAEDATAIAGNANSSVSLSHETASRGEYVYTVVSLDANSGISNLRLNVSYDNNALTLVSVTPTTLIPLPMPPSIENNPFALGFDLANPTDVTTATGNLATLRFRVADNAPIGTVPIGVSVASAYRVENFMPMRVTFTAGNGAVNIVDAAETTIAPTITNASNLTVQEGSGGSLSLTATGTAPINFTLSGAPAGVSISGTQLVVAPSVSEGTHAFTITAINEAGSTEQSFTLTVNRVTPAVVAPTITSANTLSVSEGSRVSFLLTATGTTPINFTLSGAPAGVSISGGYLVIADTVTAGTRAFTITATNEAGSDVQNFTLTVDNVAVAPTIISANALTVLEGTGGTLSLTATGTTPITFSLSGAPAGVSISGNQLTIAPTVTEGTSTFTITATNSAGNNAQRFTLTVTRVAPSAIAPRIVSLNTLAVTEGNGGSLQLNATGTAPVNFTLTNAPVGVSIIGGQLVVADTATVGTHAFPITATNEAGMYVQNFMLTVNAPERRVIRFGIDNVLFSIDGHPHLNEVAPFIDPAYNRTMIPLRAAAEALGADVEWASETRTVTMITSTAELALVVDVPLPDGKGTPTIRQSRTVVPIRYISEVLGAVVRWDSVNRAVYIYQYND
ncbi:MAG: stalk domain-containing protein [Defluviitaleaceae bacterium]|nr:stalk domain-containing protein [Defluviitaleaceae bacterium]